MAHCLNVSFQVGYRLEKQISNRLAVDLHEVGDLLVVHAFEVFKENGFFLAAGKFLYGRADFDLVFGINLTLLDFGFYGLVIRKLANFVNVEQ